MKVFRIIRGHTGAGETNLVTTPSSSLTSVSSEGLPYRRPPPARAALALINATLDVVLPLQRPRLRTWPAPAAEHRHVWPVVSTQNREIGPIMANHGIASFAGEVAKRSPHMRRKVY